MKLEQLLEEAKSVLDVNLEPWQEAEKKRVEYINQLVAGIKKKVNRKEWGFRKRVTLWHNSVMDPENGRWEDRKIVYLTPSGLKIDVFGFWDGQQLEYQRIPLKVGTSPSKEQVRYSIKPEILQALIDYAEVQTRVVELTKNYIKND